MRGAQWFARVGLVLGVVVAGLATAAPTEPAEPVRQAEAGDGLKAETGCDLPYVVREPDETVSSFKKRLRERQEALESCQRKAAEQAHASRE